MLKKMCPRCGKSEMENEFIKGFCPACFAEAKSIFKMPKALETRECSSCGKIFLGEWVQQDEKRTGSWIASKIKSAYLIKVIEIQLSKGKQALEGTAIVAFDVEGNLIEKKIHLRIALINGLCPSCELLKSGRYDTIIQIRGEQNKRERTAKKAIRALGGVVKIGEMREGIDVYSAGLGDALEVLSRLGLSYKLSKKLVGRKEGKNVYRTTLCVRV
ncbi:hypothetical protein HY991_04200 [Candidatus Micrarchaeota archaeon]|nr:hypothetical protein [Candidatus Micrarchaeota archaeon]